jgi:hypothetical protein
VLHREALSAVSVYFFGPQKKLFISRLMGRTVIDITHLGCPLLANISQQDISCSFVCHNKLRHVCALRIAYSLAQWLNFHIHSLQYAKCLTQPAYHRCSPDERVSSSYILLQRARDKVRLRLPEKETQSTGEYWDFSRPCGFE